MKGKARALTGTEEEAAKEERLVELREDGRDGLHPQYAWRLVVVLEDRVGRHLGVAGVAEGSLGRHYCSTTFNSDVMIRRRNDEMKWCMQGGWDGERPSSHAF